MLVNRKSARPTLDTVAEAAGVSPKTVSRVIRGEEYVSAATAERVLAAAAAVGFRPNALARAFREGAKLATVGLVTGDVANPFYSRIASGAEHALREPAYSLLTASNDEDAERERRIIGELIEQRVGGLLVVTADNDHSRLERERTLGTPTVFLDREPVGVEADSVVLDNRRGMRVAVEHLLQEGHRRIALIGDLSRLSTHRARVDGYAEAMRSAGIRGWEANIRSDTHDSTAASRAVNELLDTGDPPTALVATNNRIMLGVLRALTPIDSPPAIVGFDNFDLADVLGITVVSSSPEEMGKIGAEEILARILGDDSPARHHVIPANLIVRASSLRSAPR